MNNSFSGLTTQEIVSWWNKVVYLLSFKVGTRFKENKEKTKVHAIFIAVMTFLGRIALN